MGWGWGLTRILHSAPSYVSSPSGEHAPPSTPCSQLPWRPISEAACLVQGCATASQREPVSGVLPPPVRRRCSLQASPSDPPRPFCGVPNLKRRLVGCAGAEGCEISLPKGSWSNGSAAQNSKSVGIDDNNTVGLLFPLCLKAPGLRCKLVPCPLLEGRRTGLG